MSQAAELVARVSVEGVGRRGGAWRTLCRHVNGVALGTTVASLTESGVFRSLESDSERSVGELAARFGARPGYLHCALRALAGQGWLRYRMDSTGSASVGLTARGRLFAERSRFYEVHSGRLLDAAGRMDHFLFGGDPDADDEEEIFDLFERSERRWDLGAAARGATGEVEAEIVEHLDGALVGSALWSLHNRGLIPPPEHLAGRRAIGDLGDGQARPDSLELVVRLLELIGWVARAGGRVVLGEDGLTALACAGQYGYPLAYLATLRRAGALLFGGDVSCLDPGRNGDERHVDRAQDIRFSGQVFAGRCRELFFELVAPIFDAPDPSRQPRAIVDTGSGDGTLLRETWRYVTERSRRGSLLGRYPLMLVGVEPNRIAREATGRTLAACGAPYRVLDGDIDDPDGLAASLETEGLPARDCLHVSKSVVHNRSWRPPAVERPSDFSPSGAFVAPDGDSISFGMLQSNLREWFERWRRLTRRHGMVVIEAHTVPPETAYANVDRSVMTAVDLTHGYSRQYLVESEVFRSTAVAAGYRVLAARELGEDLVGHPTLSIHRLQPGEPSDDI